MPHSIRINVQNTALFCKAMEMIISERIFEILEERHMKQAEFCRRTGIMPSTVSDWHTKKTNPSADKIMTICRVLEISPEKLLQEDDEKEVLPDDDFLRPGDRQILLDYHSLNSNQQKRLLSYMKRIKKGTDERKDS